MASKVQRNFTIDGDLSRRLDSLAQDRGFSSSAMANRLIQIALARVEEERRQAAEALASAGMGTAALTLLLTVALLLG